MDRVAFDFRARVAALWKCCDSGSRYDHFPGCVDKRVPDCEWTMKSKKQGIWFYIGHDNGEWCYRFTNPWRTEGAEESLSLDELKKNPDLKHVRIGKIEVKESTIIEMHPLRTLKEMERLMKFVVFLSNEPELNLRIFNVDDFNSPEGAILQNFLSKMIFSRIWASGYGFPIYNRILENQFLRRKPTNLSCFAYFAGNEEFFIEHLGNGNIKRFSSPSFRFPAEVMERIVSRFLENPDFYDKNQFYIKARFEESTKEILERKLAEGRCEKVAHLTGSTEYRFKANNPKLEDNLCLGIRLSADGSNIIISID